MSQSNVSVTLAAFDVPSILIEGSKEPVYGQSFNSSSPLAPPRPGQPVMPTATKPFNPSEWHAPVVAPREFLLSEIEPPILLQMCEAYREEVFKRAGKSDWLLNVRYEEDNSKETVSMSQEDHKLYVMARIKQVEIADNYGFSLPEESVVITVKKNASSDEDEAIRRAEARAKEHASWRAEADQVIARVATDSAR